MAPTIITLVTTFITLTVCITLVFHQDYEDGLLGRVGLALIGIAGGVRFLDAVDAAFTDWQIYISPMGLMLYTGCALFLGRHLWRFLKIRRTKHFKRIAK